MSHVENISAVVTPQILVNIVRDGHEFFAERRVEERYEYMALDLVRRYVAREGVPREREALFGAALYVVSRHPWSQPNPMSRVEFAARLNISDASLEWYTDSIVERLGFMTLHDRTRQKFFVDPNDTIVSVMNAIVRASVGEEIVKSVVTGTVLSANQLAEIIVDRLCNVVKILPPVFESDLIAIVLRRIDEESSRILTELGGQHMIR